MRIDLSNPPALTPQRIAIWAAEDPDGTRALLRDPRFWSALLPGLQVSATAVDPGQREGWLRTDPPADLMQTVADPGWFALPGHVDTARTQPLAHGILELCRAGWAAPFIALADEAWILAAHIVDELSPLASDALRFRGELSAFCLDPSLPGGLPNGLPSHRDRAEPDAAHLTCWVALTRATEDNGCIFVTPDGEQEHALPADAGTLLGWNGRILHRGGVFHPERAEGPRITIAFALTDYAAESMWQEGMPDFMERLRRVVEVMRELQPPPAGSAMDTVLRLLEAPADHMPDAPVLDHAIERGVESLRADLQRTGEGLWHDFPRQAGGQGSNIWASAFIAAHLGRIDEGRAVAAAVVEQLLARRRESGGWGYDGRILADCDSTAWVLLAAAKAGVKVPRETLVPALRFMLAHQHPGGGFVTYGAHGRTVFGEIEARHGWFEPVPCVSAAALGALATYAPPELPATQNAACWLLAQRQAELWQPYWWYGFAYATYHAVVALQQAKVDLPRTRERTLHAVLAARNADGGFSGLVPGTSNVFATALALLTIAALDPDRLPDHADAVALLLQTQRDDGGWDGVAELRVPGGISEETLTMTDQGPFTTACVLHALDEVRRVL